MKNSNLTYEKSGVNIKAADNFVKFISSISKKRVNSKNFQNIGGFGSITNIPKHLKNPQLVASTDGVGTKIEIANELNKFNKIGIDLVAMCVNDLIVQGAKPLIFLTAFQKASPIEIKKNPAKKASRPSQKPWGVLAYASNLCSGVTNSAASKTNGMVTKYSVAGYFNIRLNSLSKKLSGFLF